MLMLLIVGCIAFLFFAIATTKGALKTYDPDGMAYHPVSKFVFAGGVPVLVAGVMTYLFIIEGGASTAQLNAGSVARVNVWRLWLSIWPLFMFLTAGSALGTFIWAVVCAARKSSRPNLGLAAGSCCLSVIAFFTVAENFPSA